MSDAVETRVCVGVAMDHWQYTTTRQVGGPPLVWITGWTPSLQRDGITGDPGTLFKQRTVFDGPAGLQCAWVYFSVEETKEFRCL